MSQECNQDLSFPAVNAIHSAQVLRTLVVSHDGGSTWQRVEPPRATTIYSLSREPGNSAIIYAATSSGLFKTQNSGQDWTRLAPSAVVAKQVIVAPKTPSTVYAVWGDSTGNPTSIGRSVDSGATWTSISDALPKDSPFNATPVIGAFAIDPVNSSVLWATNTGFFESGIFKSTDGGAHWTIMRLSADDDQSSHALGNNPDYSGIVFDGANPARVYFCCNVAGYRPGAGLFRTDDGGQSWVEGGPGPSTLWAGIGIPTLDPGDSSLVWAPWSFGAARSTDAGLTWQEVPVPSEYTAAGRGPHSLAIDASTRTIYLAGNDGGLLYSSNNGATWDYRKGPWGDNVRLLSADAGEIWVSAPVSSLASSFVAKLDPAGRVLWSTLLRGDGIDRPTAIAVDQAGDAYVTGEEHNDSLDAFVAKIRTDGSQVAFWKRIGGSRNDSATAIAVDGEGNAYIAGNSFSTDFPAVNPIPGVDSPSGSEYGFIAKVDAGGEKLLNSTLLGGNLWAASTATSIAIDGAGAALVGGTTHSPDFPLVRFFKRNPCRLRPATWRG